MYNFSSENVAQDAILRYVFIVSGRRTSDMNNSFEKRRQAMATDACASLAPVTPGTSSALILLKTALLVWS